MQFITTKPLVESIEIDQSRETLNDVPGPVEGGFDVLKKLISAVETPIDLESERVSLLALRAIHEDADLSPRGLALRKELDRCVQLVREPQARHLLEWLDVPARGLDLVRLEARTRHRRHLLLFILLAKTVGRVHDYRVPGIIENMSDEAWAKRFDHDLTWLPRYLGRGLYFEIADLYLEVASEILFENRLAQPESIKPEEFKNWPWFRQVLHLRGWRCTWNRHHQPNPAFCADRIEYQLARKGAFHQLVWRGGLIARRSLNRLQYRDLPKRGGTWPRKRLWVTGVLAASCLAAWVLIQARSADLRTQNQEIKNLVTRTLSQENPNE